MKLKQLKKCIDLCVKNAGKLNPDVEVWLNDKLFRIKEIGQFGVVPDVAITITKVRQAMKIVEGVEGFWHYHLARDGEKKALCGNERVMETSIPLSAWNSTPKDYHIPEKWCKECEAVWKNED